MSPARPAVPDEGAETLAGKLREQLTSAGTQWVAAGSLIGGLGAYLFQVLGTRALGEEAYAPISVLWTLQYLVISVPLVSLEAYVARTVARAPERHLTGATLRPLAGWLIAASAAVGAAGWLARGPLFGGLDDLALVIALVTAAYGTLFATRGVAAGRDRYRPYGLATAGESLVRLLAAGAVLAMVTSPRALGWVFPLGPALVAGAWLLLAPPRRPAAPPEGAEGGGDLVPSSSSFLAATTVANGAAQLLLAGGPLGLVVVGASAAEISIFFVTVTAARIPMVFAINGVLSRLLPPLTRMARRADVRGLRHLARLAAGVTVVVAAVAAGAAAVVGPSLVALFFGPAFRPSTLVVTAIGGAVLLGTGTLALNQVLIACQAERRLPLPWLAGLAVGVGVLLLLPTDPSSSAALGLLAGMVVALLGLAATTERTLSRMARAGASR